MYSSIMYRSYTMKYSYRVQVLQMNYFIMYRTYKMNYSILYRSYTMKLSIISFKMNYSTVYRSFTMNDSMLRRASLLPTPPDSEERPRQVYDSWNIWASLCLSVFRKCVICTGLVNYSKKYTSLDDTSLSLLCAQFVDPWLQGVS